MRTPTIRALGLSTSVLLFLAFAACGGGGGGSGGGGGGGGGGTTTQVFEATLLGSNEVAVVDPTAHAAGVVEVRSDGQIRFSVTGEGTWVSDVTGFHIHSGVAGVNGPIVVDLLTLSGGSFDIGTRTLSATVTTAASTAASILANPSGFYLNVHTTAASAGLARGQLQAFAPAEWHAILRSGEEIPVAVGLGQGAAALRVNPNLTLSYVIAMASPAVTTLMDAHIHVGPSGAAGVILQNLNLGSASISATLGTATGSVASLPLSTISRIAFDPTQFYVNVHTPTNPTGAARGQIGVGPVGVWSHLRGDQEITVVDAGARGAVTLELDTFTSGRAILSVPPVQSIGDVTGALIRWASAGATGIAVLDLQAGADFATSPSSSSAEGAIGLDQALYARLLAAPEAFYAELTTVAVPAGLVRGQLTRTPMSLFAVLSGTNEIPATDPSAQGHLTLQLTDVHACEFALSMTSPAADTIDGLHVHDGGPGISGPALIDLLNDEFQVTSTTITGKTTFSGRTFARLVAGSGFFYGDVHTAAFPNGLARGEMTLLTQDAPPAGLEYTSPVVYTSGTEITPNIPSSIGGAISAYSISPSLPSGLALNPITGVIVGTPLVAAAAADYTVTASNAAGDTQAVVNIEVLVGAPTNLSYTTPVSYVVGTPITNNSPTSSGGAIASYSVLPALPAGLQIDGTTGVISGTPTLAAAGADYTVTGTNAASSTQAVVHITVTNTLEAPSGLSYTTPVTYSTGYAITANTPTIGGGPVASWGVSPSLPAGLSFSTSTGVITGTPTVVTAAADYTVTATNATGSTQATVHVTVNLGAPTGLTYSNDPGIGYVSGGTFTTMTPSVSGGAVATWTINTPLSAGLNFNTSNGVISGSPTASIGFTAYTVTATNAAGSTQYTLHIVVY